MNAVKKFKAFVGSCFFTVRFQKQDGSWRILNGRLGVKSHLAGGVRTVSNELVVVWDCQKREYRCFDPRKAVWVKCHGMKIDFVPVKMGLMKAGSPTREKLRKAA